MTQKARATAMVVAVMVAIAGLTGSGMAPSYAAGRSQAVVAEAANSVMAKARVRATISGSYSTQASGQVLVRLVGTAKKAKIRYLGATGKKKKYRTVKLAAGAAATLLPKGSRPQAVQGLAGGGLTKSAWVPLAAGAPPAPTPTPTATVTPTPTPTPDPITPTPTPSFTPDPGSPTDFTFSAMQDSDPTQPMAWSPCRAIRIMVDLGDPSIGVPASETNLINQAAAAVASATTLNIAVVGTTELRTGRPDGADIIVRFTSDPVDADGNDGTGGFEARTAPRSPDGLSWYFITAGFVTVTTARIFSYGPTARLELYMHELAHAVGLGHAGSTTQIMYPLNDNIGETPAWGAGDMTGLTKLGKGYCPA